MADKIIIQGFTPGDTGYAIIQKESDGTVYRPANTDFQTFAQGNYANYLFGSATADDLGRIIFTIPAGIGEEGEFSLLCFNRVTGSPAYGDPIVESRRFSWNNTSLAEDYQVHDRVLKALPNAAPDAENGLPIIETGALQLNIQGNLIGNVSGNMTGSVQGSVNNVVQAVATGSFTSGANTTINAINAAVAAIQVLTDKLAQMVEADGGDFRWDTNSLEQGPGGLTADDRNLMYAMLSKLLNSGSVLQINQSTPLAEVLLHQGYSYLDDDGNPIVFTVTPPASIVAPIELRKDDETVFATGSYTAPNSFSFDFNTAFTSALTPGTKTRLRLVARGAVSGAVIVVAEVTLFVK